MVNNAPRRPLESQVASRAGPERLKAGLLQPKMPPRYRLGAIFCENGDPKNQAVTGRVAPEKWS